jgi:pimeloyl-ACP methyl ester carboxylesterase
MAIAHINGVSINYEVHGDHGPWVALTPGGRRGLDEIRSLAGRVAAGGYRVLIHDRRNCGASEASVAGEGAEHEIWAEDMHALLEQLGALPAYVGGSSSGCRMSIQYALRHPQAVRGLLLWRVTGGAFAVRRLTEKYYGEYMRAAQNGGMAAVCETEHFRELIAARPANRQMLMQMDPQRFIEAMSAWDRQFRTGADQPVIGASEAQLKSIAQPACVVPGNDRTHPNSAAAALARLMPNAELHPLMGEDLDVDVDAPENWDAREAGLAAILLGCLRRMGK